MVFDFEHDIFPEYNKSRLFYSINQYDYNMVSKCLWLYERPVISSEANIGTSGLYGVLIISFYANERW